MKTFGYISALACFCLASVGGHAQENGQQQDNDEITVNGSIQSDILFPQSDEKIGAPSYSETALTNSFAEVSLTSRHGDAGLRFEYLQHPLPGFDEKYAGYGVPYFYVKGHWQGLEVTLGNYYEQFGSGFILRTYEDRSLGIDNSLRGARIVAKPFKGVTVKALAGQQRAYWDYNDAWIYGADAEFSFDQWIKALEKSNTFVTLGASWITKHEASEDIMVDATHKLNLPENVGAYDLRLRVQKGGLNVLAEYAQKMQDPEQLNGYIYRKGYAAMLSASYSQRGMSLLLQAKRSDNMTFRSARSRYGGTDNSSYLNHLPAFTMDHTYALAALYPYATNADGEWAYQAELGYNFKRHTLLGGKYGTKLKANFSYVRAIQQNLVEGTMSGSDGYTSPFFKWGDQRYYQDFNVQVEKKLSKSFDIHLMYMNQFYNQQAVEQHGEPMIHSNIFIAEGKYRFNNVFTLRGEAQYLTTNEDQGDWAYGLLELSVLPHWMITASDMYNVGTTEIHYYQGLVTFTTGAHRLQAGYGRTRAGYNCAGGVCRWIPATKGFTLSYNYNF